MKPVVLANETWILTAIGVIGLVLGAVNAVSRVGQEVRVEFGLVDELVVRHGGHGAVHVVGESGDIGERTCEGSIFGRDARHVGLSW